MQKRCGSAGYAQKKIAFQGYRDEFTYEIRNQGSLDMASAQRVGFDRQSRLRKSDDVRSSCCSGVSRFALKAMTLSQLARQKCYFSSNSFESEDKLAVGML